jgi:hypothetical protein
MPDDRLLIRLKYGVWNQWREENPGIAINLDGAALDGMVLTNWRLFLSGAAGE